MMGWEPTMNLRFVKRRVTQPLDEYTSVEKTVRILQQQWRKKERPYVATPTYEYEWRDVPEVDDE
jgi:hypothetical protein